MEKVKPRLSDYEVSRKAQAVSGLYPVQALLSSFCRCVKRRNATLVADRVHEYRLQSVAEFLGLHYATISTMTKRVLGESGSQK